jgi:hypothetical protein
MTDEVVKLYSRLAGRRDMNERSARRHGGSGFPFFPGDARLDELTGLARSDSYQNAINDLCDAFHVTEEELRQELEAHHET